MPDQQLAPVTVKLPNGAVMRVSVPVSRSRVAEDVGAAAPMFDMGRVGQAIEGIGDLIKGALVNLKPTKTTVELGFSFDVEGGKLTALLVNGKLDADLKITLEWGAGGGGAA